MRQARPGQPRSSTSRSAAAAIRPRRCRPGCSTSCGSTPQRQIGPFTKVVDHRAGLFRRGPPQGHEDAGYIAGLEVLDIINEPTAAAVAFGFQQGFMNAGEHGQRARRRSWSTTWAAARST